MTVHVPLTILGFSAEKTTAPAPEESGYDIAFRLSRPVSPDEARTIREVFGEKASAGARGTGAVTLRAENDVLIVRNTTIENLERLCQRDVARAVATADNGTRERLEEERRTALRLEEHRAHVAEAAERLTWG